MSEELDNKKNDIISAIYFDRSGFGSKKQTLKDAREKDKSITMADIDKFFSQNVEQKKQIRGRNTFIAPEPFYEFQMDLFFINDLKNQKFKAGVIMIDVFSRFMTVVPIKKKDEDNVAAGMIEALNKMGGKPKILFTDDEGALNTKSIPEYLEKEGIQHHRTRAHANHSERAIRTFKDMLYKRVEADEKKGKQNIQWIDYIFEILLTYNNKMEHSAIKMTPKEAMKEKNELKAKNNMHQQAVRTRNYPNISVGDKVKIYRKRKPGEKERVSQWLPQIQEIERIEQKNRASLFYVKGSSRPYMRFELLKV